MSKTTGYVDDDNTFSLLATFDPQSPSDTEEMLKLLSEEEANATVRDYGPDFVEVVYRPDFLAEYGF